MGGEGEKVGGEGEKVGRGRRWGEGKVGRGKVGGGEGGEGGRNEQGERGISTYEGPLEVWRGLSPHS